MHPSCRALGAVAILAAGAGACAKPVLALRAQAVAERESVTVGDVAELSGIEPGEREQLARRIVAAAPRVGQESVIGRFQVLAVLPAGWSGGGAPAVTVRRATQVLGPDALCAAALAAAGPRLDPLGPAIEHAVECRRDAIEPVEVPAGALALRADPAQLRLVDGPQRLDVRVDVGGRGERVVPVALALSLHATQWCARAPLPEGTDLAPDAFAACHVPVRHAAQLATAGATLPTGRLRRALHADELLAAADIAAADAALAGDPVTVRLHSGMFALESRGALVQDARVGDQVRVRVSRAAEPLVGRLTGRGLVELEEQQ